MVRWPSSELVLEQAAAGAPLEKTVERAPVAGRHDYTRTRYADRTGEAVLEAWLIHGAAHAWSGVAARVPTPIRKDRMKPRG